MVTRQEFYSTCAAGKSVNATHKLVMESVVNGPPHDADRMHQHIAEIELPHDDWMHKGDPFLLRNSED